MKTLEGKIPDEQILSILYEQNIFKKKVKSKIRERVTLA